MNRQYVFLAVLMFLLAAGLLLVPHKTNVREATPEALLAETLEPSRFVSTDEVARRIIQEDPGLVLADVRESREYNDFSLKGAVNLPFSALMEEGLITSVASEEKDLVLYSTDDYLSEKAWILCKRMGIKRVYIMEGGLNRWASTIMQPVGPEETDPSEVRALYDFRRAAGMSLYGGGIPSGGKEAGRQTVRPKAKVSREYSSDEGC